MRSCLGLMLDMGKNPSQLLKSANWWTNECHQQERHDWCAMCHVSYQYCSSAPFYISPFTPFSCPPPPHQPWSRMSALILFWPTSCSITESQKLAPKIWPFSLDIFPSKTTSGSTGSAKSSLVIWMTRNSWKNKREFVIYHDRHWQTGMSTIWEEPIALPPGSRWSGTPWIGLSRGSDTIDDLQLHHDATLSCCPPGLWAR